MIFVEIQDLVEGLSGRDRYMGAWLVELVFKLGGENPDQQLFRPPFIADCLCRPNLCHPNLCRPNLCHPNLCPPTTLIVVTL